MQKLKNGLCSVGAFLFQWIENIDFIYHEYFGKDGFDGVNFPLTANPYGLWAIYPKSKKGRKVMRGVKRFMGPMECYAFIREHRELAFIGLGSSPGPRTYDEAFIALGNEGEAKMWQERHEANEKWQEERKLREAIHDTFFSLPADVRREYYDTYAQYGAGSLETVALREKYKNIDMFARYADAVDGFKESLREGSSIHEESKSPSP